MAARCPRLQWDACWHGAISSLATRQTKQLQKMHAADAILALTTTCKGGMLLCWTSLAQGSQWSAHLSVSSALYVQGPQNQLQGPLHCLCH